MKNAIIRHHLFAKLDVRHKVVLLSLIALMQLLL